MAASDGAPAGPRQLPGWVAFLMAIGLVWLAGQFVTQGLSDAFLDSRPGYAVLWRGDSSDALTRFAEQQIGDRRYELAARIAGKALQLSPLNERALAALGVALGGSGQPGRADQVMSLAGRRSWRDVPAQIWLLRTRLLHGQYADGFAHVDALLRRAESYPPVLLQILTIAARDPKAIDPLAARLATNPPWREVFFLYLAANPDPSAPNIAGALLTRLKASPAPPTEHEVGFYVARLIKDRKYPQAEAAWRRLSPIPAPAGLLVDNGGFERAPGGTPFDWILADGVGWTARIAAAPGGRRGQALELDYDGVSPSQDLEQFVVLAPGAYRLSGDIYDATGAGADTVSWRVICVGGQPAATAATGDVGQGQWRKFSVDFAVPPQGCPAQWLTLRADPGDVRKDVELWYDNLAITPIAGVAPAPATSANIAFSAASPP